jgi:chemotaxis receptor (MCP) glutamine deamidase CheD
MAKKYQKTIKTLQQTADELDNVGIKDITAWQKLSADLSEALHSIPKKQQNVKELLDITEKAKINPFLFVDTGVPALFRGLYDLGGQKSRMVIKAAGCGNPLGNNEMFRIGERNYTVLKKLLWKNNILLETEEVGGTASRTVHLEIATGQITITSNGQQRNL